MRLSAAAGPGLEGPLRILIFWKHLGVWPPLLGPASVSVIVSIEPGEATLQFMFFSVQFC